jgi:hypothetical protein
MAGTIRIEGENLVLELHGVDRILAFKSSFTIPLKHVTSVSTERVGWTQYLGMKVGTSLPGVVKDGRYLTTDGWMFFEMHDPDQCITVSLNDEEYKKIVFQVEDKESAATLIRQVIPASTSA